MREAEHVHLRPGGGGALKHTHEMSESEPHSHEGALPFTPPAKTAKARPFAELDADTRNSLSDSDFAYIDKDGGRHLPIHDRAHVRAALSRFGQTHFDSPSAKTKAAAKIRARAKSLGIDAGPLDMAEPAVVRFMSPKRLDLSEKLIPYATVGDWEWSDFGHVRLDRLALDDIERHFRDNVRGQDLPVVNEDHDRSRAVGWITDMVRESPDRLLARVDFNAVGEELLANDQYRYVSPQLVWDYTDAASRQRYSVVGAGTAITNYPRMKSLGPIAKSNGVAAGVLAFGEGPHSGPVWDMAEKLMARDMAEYGVAPDDPDDPDGDGDHDGMTPPCIFQPPYVAVGVCPGWTRRQGDTDGDGTCALAADCNGYIAVGNSQPLPMIGSSGFSEPIINTTTGRVTMPPDAPATGGDTPPATPAPAAPTNQGTQSAGDFAEMRNIVAAADRAKQEAERRAAEAEARAKEFSERLAQTERANKIALVEARVEALGKANRLTPAEVDTYKQEANLLHFSEHPEILDAAESRPQSAVPFGELGTSQTPVSDKERETALAAAVKEFSERQRAAGKPVNPAEAAKYAYERMRSGR